MEKREKKRKNFICRWVALGGIGLLLYGCASDAAKPIEGSPGLYGEMESQEGGSDIPISRQVLEVGIMADDTNPYAAAVYKAFCLKAGEGSVPVVVEFHDGRDGYETQKWQLEVLRERGVDLLLVNMADMERQAELAEDICQADIPVLYFGTRPSEALLEKTEGQYVGLPVEEETKLGEVLEAEQFEESEFPDLAQKVGEALYRTVLEAGTELVYNFD